MANTEVSVALEKPYQPLQGCEATIWKATEKVTIDLQWAQVSLKLEELHSVAQLQFCLMTQTLLEAKFPRPSNNEMP